MSTTPVATTVVTPDRSPLRLHINHAHIHPEWGVQQVGWLGQTGGIYALYDPPYDDREPGSFAPLYVARDEECGHVIAEDTA